MASVAGYLNRILVNNTVLRAHRWTVDWKADDFDVTTFENAGVGTYLPGIVDFTITADAYWDTVDNPYNNPLHITPGQFVAIRILHDKTGVVTSARFNFPSALICDVREESGSRDVIRFNFTAKASVYPTPAQAVTLTTGIGVPGV